jgi:hypothetical protein
LQFATNNDQLLLVYNMFRARSNQASRLSAQNQLENGGQKMRAGSLRKPARLQAVVISATGYGPIRQPFPAVA